MPAFAACIGGNAMLRTAIASLALVMLAACSPPKPPEEERRPEPQAQAATQPQSTIVQTADAYKDRARDAAKATEAAAKDESARIDAATQ